MREALLEAAAVTAAAERDASRHDAQAQAEASRLQQEAQRAEEAWRQQAEEAERSAEAARRRAEAAEQQLEAARSAQEAAGRQGVEDARAREELTARCEALEADIEAIVDKVPAALTLSLVLTAVLSDRAIVAPTEKGRVWHESAYSHNVTGLLACCCRRSASCWPRSRSCAARTHGWSSSCRPAAGPARRPKSRCATEARMPKV